MATAVKVERAFDERDCVNFYRMVNVSGNSSHGHYDEFLDYEPGSERYNEAVRLCRVNSALWNAAPPIYFAIGTVGNLLSVAVWSSRRLAHQTQYMSIALMCLGISDTLVLYTGLLRHYLRKSSYIGWNLQNAGTVVCKTHEFLVYCGLSLSAWLVAFVAFERCLSVVLASPRFLGRCKLSSSGSCGRPRSLYVTIAMLVTVCVSVNAHIFWTRVYRAQECIYDRHSFPVFLDKVWPKVDLVFAAAMPVVLVIVSTVSIAITLYCMKSRTLLAQVVDSQCELRLRSTHPSVTSESGSGATAGAGKPYLRKTRSQSIVARKTNKITVTLVCVSLCYIVCTCPAKIYLVVIPTVVPHGVGPLEYFRYRLVWTSVLLLQYLTNVINFIIYSMANTLFRKELTTMLRRIACTASVRTAQRVFKTTSAISAMSSSNIDLTYSNKN